MDGLLALLVGGFVDWLITWSIEVNCFKWLVGWQ